ncbi:hypothetical protein BaRGS_00029531 [Batillaria attramentaria]|uniref:Uncharacterized protein n=1 Tax=Batillaria attramentaria TaxID=370345 RepID=A0ABD0JW36_9CAEN
MSHPRVLLDDEACDRGPTNTDPVDKLHTAPSCGGSVLSHSTVLAAAWHSGSQTIGVWSRKLSGVVLKSKVQTSNAIMSRDFFRSQPSGKKPLREVRTPKHGPYNFTTTAPEVGHPSSPTQIPSVTTPLFPFTQGGPTAGHCEGHRATRIPSLMICKCVPRNTNVSKHSPYLRRTPALGEKRG